MQLGGAHWRVFGADRWLEMVVANHDKYLGALHLLAKQQVILRPTVHSPNLDYHHSIQTTLITEPNSARTHQVKAPKTRFLGIFSFTITILLLLFLLQNLNFSTTEQSPLFYLLGTLFVGVGSSFLLIEMFWAKEPLIPIDMVKGAFAYCLAQAFLAVGRNAVRLLSLQSRLI